jgi:translation elongation factor EF-1beta
MEEFNVAADIKIFLDDEAKADSVKKELEKIAKVRSSRIDDGPFGIKILFATLLLNDDKGGMDALEAKIAEIDGVSQLEVENITRI